MKGSRKIVLIWQINLYKWKEKEMWMEGTKELGKLEVTAQEEKRSVWKERKNQKLERQILKSKGMKAIGSGQERRKTQTVL